MNKNISKVAGWAVLLALMCGILMVVQWPDANVHVVFCDVGQGDAVLISHGSKQILVDGGPSEAGVMQCLQEYMPFWDNHIDVVVATHPDADHIGGLAGVLQRYQVQYILETDAVKETQVFQRYRSAIEVERVTGGVVIRPSLNQIITLTEKVKARVIIPENDFPLVEPIKNSTAEAQLWDAGEQPGEKNQVKLEGNDLSIALILDVGEIEFALMGDLESRGETALLESGVLQDVEVLKVAHHGSKTSSTRQVLEVLQPEEAVISSGKNNRYGHPSPEVLSRFLEMGVNMWRTDTQGSIEFVTDGQSYWVE